MPFARTAAERLDPTPKKDLPDNSPFRLSHIAPGGLKAIKIFPGFTLVEILITIAVLAFGCLAVLLLQSSAMRGNTLSDNMTVATFLAESELERLKSLTREKLSEEIEAGTTVVRYLNRLGQICPKASAGQCRPYPFARTLSFYPKKPTAFSSQAEVEVAWTDNSGPHKILYAAILTSYTF
jgi:prepilin-type N-terminal cleavage/methylation domain-containing protein